MIYHPLKIGGGKQDGWDNSLQLYGSRGGLEGEEVCLSLTLRIFFSYYFLMFPFESWLFLDRRQTEIDEILKYCRKVYKAKIFLHIIFFDHCSLFVMWGFECG